VVQEASKRLSDIAKRLQIPLDAALARVFKTAEEGKPARAADAPTVESGAAGTAPAEAQPAGEPPAGAESGSAAAEGAATATEGAAPGEPAAAAAPPESAGAEGATGAEEGEEAGHDNVIDLEAFRKALQDRKGGLGFRIGETLRETLSNFIEARVLSTRTDSAGTFSVNLDQDFIKEHGSSIVKQALQDLYRTLVPPKIELNLPAGPGAPKGEAGEAKEPEVTGEGAAPPAGAPAGEGASETAGAGGPAPGKEAEGEKGVRVSLNVDLSSLLGRLFKPKGGMPPSQ
jgi:hypothetical protein